MMPSLEVFTQNMRKLRLEKKNEIVCYDGLGMFSVARVAWMLRYFGAKNVRILDGGLKKWKAEGRKVVGGDQVKHGEVLPNDKGDYSFTEADKSIHIESIEKMHNVARLLHHSSDHDNIIVLDARSAGRFTGIDPEPYAGLRSGAIRNSINIPFTNLVNEDGTLKTTKEIDAILKKDGVHSY